MLRSQWMCLHGHVKEICPFFSTHCSTVWTIMEQGWGDLQPFFHEIKPAAPALDAAPISGWCRPCPVSIDRGATAHFQLSSQSELCRPGTGPDSWKHFCLCWSAMGIHGPTRVPSWIIMLSWTEAFLFFCWYHRTPLDLLCYSTEQVLEW